LVPADSVKAIAARPDLDVFSSLWVRIALVLAAFAFLTQAVSLVVRAALSASDFSVFYRTAQMLGAGAGSAIYNAHDAVTGWLRCIPPAGMLLFQPLALLPPEVAGAVWATLNILFVGGTVLALRAFFQRLDFANEKFARTLPWACVVLLLLSVGSIQVGQLSIFFVFCWMLALLALARQRSGQAGWWLAIPAAIKLYPLLLMSVPWVLKKGRMSRASASFLCGLVVFSGVLPFMVYGRSTPALTSSFLRNVIFSSHGRVAESQGDPLAVSNQGLDAVLLRYGCSDARFNQRFRFVPHADLTHSTAIRIANLLRLGVLLAAAAALWRQKRRLQSTEIYSALMATALVSTTLFLILPGAKSRYGVYDFIGFLPLLAMAQRERDDATRSMEIAVIIGCLLGVTSFVPAVLRAFGVGFLGALVLWLANLRYAWQASPLEVSELCGTLPICKDISKVTTH
jgi:hypothetical protein